VETEYLLIQLFRPSYDGKEIEAVAEVLKTGWTSLGPMTAMFENAFAEFCSTRHCVGLSNGTAALQMALKLLGIGKGDEVIVPAMTFVSTAHCVMNAGATPVFSDICPSTHNIDPAHAGELVTERTRAVIAVHLAGFPVNIDVLRTAVGDIPVIEDCAHAAGTAFNGRPAGSEGIAGCFSFHAVKNISMGEGGALVTDRSDFSRRARRLRWLGIDRETWDRTRIDRSYWWEYKVDEVGTNCHLDDIHAAIGLVQLRKLEGANARRREIAELYRTGLCDLSEVDLPPGDTDNIRTSWHMYRIEADHRDELNVFMGSNGVCTGVHYKPLHLYGCYGRQPSLPVAEKVFQRTLSLPMYPDLGNDEVGMVIDSLRRFYHG